MSPSEINHLDQTFIQEKYQTTSPHTYGSVFFTDMGKLIVDMITAVMGFNTSEYVDELTLISMYIFNPGQTPTIMYDYASFITNKIHDQFIRLENERVFKYTTFINHLMLSYRSDNFPFPIIKLNTKGNPRSVIFWTSVFHKCPSNCYSYNEFIDQFVHSATTLLTGFHLLESVVTLRRSFSSPNKTRWVTGIYTRTI